MKPTNLILAALAAVVVVSGLTSYFAYEAGYRRALGLKKTSLVGSLDGLERIRTGDVARGTALIEQDSGLLIPSHLVRGAWKLCEPIDVLTPHPSPLPVEGRGRRVRRSRRILGSAIFDGIRSPETASCQQSS